MKTSVDRKAKPPIILVTNLLFSLTFLAAVVLVPWYGVSHGYEVFDWIMLVVILMFNGTAITAGYHRLWAHKAYKAHWSLRLWFALWGAMAIQNSIMHWTSGHRRHHQHVDDYDLDPYSAKRGFWFSHIGWMLRSYDKEVGNFSNIKDLQKDPVVIWQHHYYIPIVLAMNFGVPLLIGLLSGNVMASLLLAGVLRLVLSHHCTFFINSLAHIWGKRPFTDKNTARDNGLLALFTWGEGYHNFHHVFSSDYRNGVRWWQFDPIKWLIFSASKIRLTSGLRRVSDFRIEKARIDMQFKRAGQKLSCEQALANLEKQYQELLEALKEWYAFRQQWLEGKAEELRNQWESLDMRTQYEELKSSLKEQKGRWQLALMGQLA
ncbi:fatty acid desaturase [Sansalvadorimonas sp. 2012CJ34-2]|uniref:Fatty acid desaturase n=1 Tax=Parendozoicomonas callyspongiae TaxID=2942213 RepID=A0ABT0PH18_9GAMM|nr:fatty acid desaturase [Sansalvadorimonas sp. 2012CJ34-2]MCL6270638.1 fatty acid desaturase [Sansalvadorimonas sp. 2012CJ34-2]